MNKFLIQNIWPVQYTYLLSPFSNIYFLAVRQHGKNMSTYPGLNSVQSTFNCLLALTNPDAYLSCAKFSSSLLDIKICHKQWKLVPSNQGMSFIGVI